MLPHPLDAAAAERFFGSLYTRMLDGDRLAEATAEGRRALAAERRRGSLFGPLPLQDWFVPMLYQHGGSVQPVRAAGPARRSGESTPGSSPSTDCRPAAAAGRPAVTEQLIRVRQHVGEVCRSGQFGLIGRDGELLRLDAALSNPNRPWALLTGPGGIGKSALASDFGRWYFETGGCPGGVFFSSFESQGGIRAGAEQHRHPPRRFLAVRPGGARGAAADYLRATPCLLILDHLETANGYPDGAPPLASERDRRDLGRFLQGLHGGKTRVLMTSRKTDESGWGRVREVPLEGLASHPAGVLAALIMRSVGKDAGRVRQRA